MKNFLTFSLVLLFITVQGCVLQSSDSVAGVNDAAGDNRDDEQNGTGDLSPDGSVDDSEYPNSSGGDEEEINGQEGDGDPSSSHADDLILPFLVNLSGLQDLFGEELTSYNIDYGEQTDLMLTETSPYAGITFDALAGANITATVSAPSDSFVSPVLVLYGPKSSTGLWSREIAMKIADEGQHEAFLYSIPIDTEGQYLLLATGLPIIPDTPLEVTLGCHGQCVEPYCPDNTCQAFCPEGFRLDANGCPSCQCREATCSCLEDEDCPQGHYCMDCQCLPEENPPDGDDDLCGCPDDWDPVCTEDGTQFANDCIALCLLGPETTFMPCNDPGDTCVTDEDCIEGTMCVAGVCSANTDCNCTGIYDPVCGVNGVTYANECEASCIGVAIAYIGDCSDPANLICEPVCISASGTEAWNFPCTGDVVFDSCLGCYASCDQAETRQEGWYAHCIIDDIGEETITLIQYADCVLNCGCPDTWEPVCSLDGVTYPNLCELDCADAMFGYEGECEEGIFGCLENSDCPTGEICMLDNLEGCSEDDYGSSPECTGFCIEYPDVNDMPCTANADCPAGYACVEGYCQVSWSADDCIITGRHGEICANEEVTTQSAYSDEFACYGLSECTLLETGECGWLETPDFLECLSFTGRTECDSDGQCTSGQYCSAEGFCQTMDCQCPGIVMPICLPDGNRYASPCIAACENITEEQIDFCE